MSSQSTTSWTRSNTKAPRERTLRRVGEGSAAHDLETSWVLGSPLAVLTLVARGDLILDSAFDFGAEMPRLLELCRKYTDRPMDRANACLVRMTELTVRCKVWTVDREDFTTYRRQRPISPPPRSRRLELAAMPGAAVVGACGVTAGPDGGNALQLSPRDPAPAGRP